MKAIFTLKVFRQLQAELWFFCQSDKLQTDKQFGSQLEVLGPTGSNWAGPKSRAAAKSASALSLLLLCGFGQIRLDKVLLNTQVE